MVRSSIVAALIFLVISLLRADTPETFSRVRIFVADHAVLDRIWNTGIDFEGSSGKVGGWMEFITGPAERERLNAEAIPYDVIDADLSAHYRATLAVGPVNAMGFGYGSMGGYYTYIEIKQQLDSMRLLYPTLISAIDTIGYSIEGRPIWAVTISDNPNNIETGEPEVLYTALHHAREPEGMMTVLYYMWWLLENYGTNQDATYLVNNRQMYFVPVVNPDGYVYNQTTNPGGGGMWRKNRRNNGDGSYGVDLNRNYGTEEMWNSPFGGSSTTPGSETYRGTSAFSEPETQIISGFFSLHDFKVCLNYHTFGDDIIMPWGFQPWETLDSTAFREFAFDLVKDNRYTSGTDMQTVGYVTRGTSDDYMYAGIEGRKTFAMTPEVGTSGFWPPTYEILPLAQENLTANIYLAYVGGQSSYLKRFDILDADNDGFPDPGEQFTLATTIRNRGLGDASNLSVDVASSSSLISFDSTTKSIPNLPTRSEYVLTFPAHIQPNCQTNVPIQIFVSISDAQGYLHQDTMTVFIGQPIVLLSDSAEHGMDNWDPGSGWGTANLAHSGADAFSDSPYGNYSANSDNALTLKTPLDLTQAWYANLKFWTLWVIEPTWDFGTIEVSTDSGLTWSSIATRLSRHGSGRAGSQQPSSAWGYDGYTPEMNWIEQEADLTPFVGNRLLLRFRLASDGGEQRDGWYLDDIRVYGYQPNNSIAVSLRSGWQMVSVPLTVRNFSKESIFPNASSDAFSYHGRYEATDTLEPARGYWIKFTLPETISIGGALIETDTIDLLRGWNMVGGISCPTAVSDMVCDPPPCRPFVYRDSYVEPDTIAAGEGFWMKGPKTIILSCQAESSLQSTNSMKLFSDDFRAFGGRLRLTDHTGRTGILYFGISDYRDVSLESFDLPPVPPLESFDVRFASQRIAELFTVADSGIASSPIILQSAAFPLRIDWQTRSTESGCFDLIERSENGSTSAVHNLIGSGSFEVVNPDLSSLVLVKRRNGTPIPYRFALMQNYPNPFNPTTEIGFELGTASIVTVTLYNVLGERVRTLLSEQTYDAGHHSVQFDGSGLPSGLYVYKLAAKQIEGMNVFRATKKMIFAK